MKRKMLPLAAASALLAPPDAGLAYQPNRRGDPRSVWAVSAAALYKATDTLQFVADIGLSRNTESTAGTNPAFVIAGAIYSPKRRLDLGIGYRHGLNDQTYHHSVMGGVTARW
nr:hypothetical protein [Burkholderia diffusa]